MLAVKLSTRKRRLLFEQVDFGYQIDNIEVVFGSKCVPEPQPIPKRAVFQ
jgi:hypothetical protein